MGVTALLPIKHESERVPTKNYRMLGSKPLYRHMLDKLLGLEQITEILINTDSPTLPSQLAGEPKVTVIPRPGDLLGHRVSMTRIIAHDCSLASNEIVLQVHATSPFLSPATLTTALQTFHDIECDSLFGVNLLQTRLYWSDLTAINHNIEALLPTQELPFVYEENSALYVFDRQVGLSERRLGVQPFPFVVPQIEATDIDTESDWDLVEQLWMANV